MRGATGAWLTFSFLIWAWKSSDIVQNARKMDRTDIYTPPPQVWSRWRCWKVCVSLRGSCLWSCLQLSCNRHRWIFRKWVLSSKDVNQGEKNTQKRFDIEVVSGENDFKEHLLINGDEFLVPLIDVRCALPRLVLVGIRLCCGQRLATVMFAVFKNLSCMR